MQCDPDGAGALTSFACPGAFCGEPTAKYVPLPFCCGIGAVTWPMSGGLAKETAHRLVYLLFPILRGRLQLF